MRHTTSDQRAPEGPTGRSPGARRAARPVRDPGRGSPARADLAGTDVVGRYFCGPGLEGPYPPRRRLSARPPPTAGVPASMFPSHRCRSGCHAPELAAAGPRWSPAGLSSSGPAAADRRFRRWLSAVSTTTRWHWHRRHRLLRRFTVRFPDSGATSRPPFAAATAPPPPVAQPTLPTPRRHRRHFPPPHHRRRHHHCFSWQSRNVQPIAVQLREVNVSLSVHLAHSPV